MFTWGRFVEFRTLIESAREILVQEGGPKESWSEDYADLIQDLEIVIDHAEEEVVG